MYLLAASYDLTNYPAVRAVCIILTLILAGIVLAIAITNYIREGKFASANNLFYGPDTDNSDRKFSGDKSSAEESVAEEPVTEEPVAEEPVTEEPVTEEPVAEEPVAEEPVAEEPVAEEPVAEEPVAEEPVAEEPVAEEPVTDEPVAEEPVAEEPVAEEPVTDEPVAEVAAAVVEETAEDDYSVLPSFFEKLTAAMSEEDKDTFADLIAGEGRVEKTRLKYPLTVYEDATAFLKDFFLSAGKFKTVMPVGAMETLYKKRNGQVKTDAEKTRLNNKMIAFYFARRKTDDNALEKCIKLCKKDVAFNYENRDVRGMKLPALKRLILIYTAQKRFEEAIKLCDEAITREVIEKKDEGYEDRRARIVGKMKRAAEIAAEKAAKAQAKAAKQSEKPTDDSNEQ